MEALTTSLDNQVAIREDVAYRKLGDHFFIYSLCTGETNRLTGVGLAIWERLAQGTSLARIAEAISHQFSVPLSQVEQDVCEFVQNLYAHALVTVDGRNGHTRRSSHDATRWQPSSMIDEVSRLRIPFRIDLELTYACNLACAYCYTPKGNRRLLSTTEIESVLDQLAQAGTMFLCFTGGEPFARKDVEKLIACAQERRFALLVLTNATLITPERAALLARTSTVQVSMHGARPATHDAWTKLEGSFAGACRGIQHLVEAGANVYVIFNATYHNIQEEDTLRRLCEKWGVGFKLNVHLLPNVGNGSLDPLGYRVSDDDVRHLIQQGKLRPERSVCTAGTTKARISPLGEIYACELLRRSFGDLREQRFEDIWWGAEMEAFRASEFFAVPRACQGCEWQRYCRRCPALAEMEDQNAYGPSSEACRIARLGAEVETPTTTSWTIA